MSEATNTYPNLNTQTKPRLNEIDKIKLYFNAEIVFPVTIGIIKKY